LWSKSEICCIGMNVKKQFLLFALRHQYNPNDYMNLPSYNFRLNIIDLETLESRRNNSSAIFVFNILNGKINSEELKNHVKLNNNRTTRISQYLLETNHTSNYDLVPSSVRPSVRPSVCTTFFVISACRELKF
jgi:hypothetical protein